MSVAPGPFNGRPSGNGVQFVGNSEVGLLSGGARLNLRFARDTGAIRQTDSVLFAVTPRSQTRYPPWDIRAELLVLRPVSFPQGRLFIDENKQMESRPNCNAVCKNADAAEKQPLTQS